MKVSDACKDVFEKIKSRKLFRYAVFAITDEKMIDVEVIGNREDSTYQQFLHHLQRSSDEGEKECRYGVYDFEYAHQCQGTEQVKLITKFKIIQSIG